jgi:peptidoglycan/xylan/chitin deacetylase (PgdA/CDA1 family)
VTTWPSPRTREPTSRSTPTGTWDRSGRRTPKCCASSSPRADLTTLTRQEIVEEIEQNESWIETTFGVTARPWLRPPYGRHDARTDAIAASLGYTHIEMWDGSFADSTLITADQLMACAERYIEPTTIMIGHANHMTVVPLFGQILDLIARRGLVPVTLDEMFGTSRDTGSGAPREAPQERERA